MSATAQIVSALTAVNPALGTTRLVCVDGPAGSGKTTLAADVEAAIRRQPDGLNVAVLHLDDLYLGWTGLNPELETRVSEQVLLPLSEGRAARWQRYDWYAGELGEWVDLAVPDILLVEGCGSGAAAYAPYRSLLVWIEAPPETRITRGVARDGEQVLADWLAWMQSEEQHFSLNDTRRRADITLASG